MSFHRQYIPCFRALAIVLTLQTSVSWAGGSSNIPAYQAGAGVLSYTFFNLTGNACTMTPYGGGPNPAAYYYLAQLNGWDNTNNPNNPIGGFFNTYSLPSATAATNFVFYNNADPINTSSIPANPITLLSGKGGTGAVAITSSQLETSSSNESINYPAMGDSWSISCASDLPPIAVANLASAASALQSGGGTAYPYNASLSGFWENSTIIPSAWAGCGGAYGNPCGTGFLAYANMDDPPTFDLPLGNISFNWNVSSSTENYQAMGGLWTGINYNAGSCGTAPYTGCSDSAYPGYSLLNMPMLPINLSAYVQGTQNSANTMSYTPIYGGHFTVAMGDPFLVTSYAAKMLWYLVASSTFSLSDDTTLSNIASNLSGTNGQIFNSSSYESNYVQWLLGSSGYTGSPALAANAYKNAYQAASTAITHESVWGKIFTGLADTAIDIAIAGTEALPGGEAVDAIATGVATSVGGTVVPDMNAAITNAFTTTISGPAPLSQNAPAVINPTYAATNLFGLLLTNSGVQEQINQIMAPINPDFQSNPNPYWSNYSIYTDYMASTTPPSGCVSENSGTDIKLANNLLSGNCYNSSGALVTNDGTLPEDTYTNVYASNQSTQSFSIWDSILTGSDVTTSSKGNGYIALGDNVGDIPSFSPPIQLTNATNGGSAPTTALPFGLAVNTTFSLNTGTVSAVSFSGYIDPATAGSYPAPAAMPQYNQLVSYKTSSGYQEAYFSSSSNYYPATYNSTTGVFTLTGYCVYTANILCTSSTDFTALPSPVSINMTACIPGSSILVSQSTQNPETVTLECQFATNLDVVNLNYQSCTSDIWATGGVLSAVTTVPNTDTGLGGEVTLACACVPYYLDGPGIGAAKPSQLLGGVVVGATSQYPDQQCPLPSN